MDVRTAPARGVEIEAVLDATGSVELLLRDLRSSRAGLSKREAQRRLLQYGPNELSRRGGARWPGELARQLTHPLALLLWVAAGLSLAVGNETVAIAVLLVILLNAAFAFMQELQAERAVEALARYMPLRARALRDGVAVTVDALALVPGDVVVLEEGDRVAADVRLLSGAVEVDLSTLTGESVSVLRAADLVDHDVPRLEARDLVFSGTTCTGGEARGVVFATGMHTELGRIASLSERVSEQPSPLERQVRRVAWLIAGVAVGLAAAFVPLAIFGAGLSPRGAVVFAVGLLAGNVPEGLLPVITLALAVAVSALARRGALVKRLSAVETLGSTDVICTDKTGTLTENRMRPTTVWTPSSEVRIERSGGGAERNPAGLAEIAEDVAVREDAAVRALAETAAACNNARLATGVRDGEAATVGAAGAAGEAGKRADGGGAPEGDVGDPTEIAVLLAARALGADVDPERRERSRRHLYNFDPERKLMSTLDAADDDGGDTEATPGQNAAHGPAGWLHTKGAPESVLPRCTTTLSASGELRPLTQAERERVTAQVEAFAREGLRVLALARRRLPPAQPSGASEAGQAEPATATTAQALPREQAERELCFLGLATMLDPPRAEVHEAVARCHSAGIRVIVITGDHPITAAAIASQVGIGGEAPRAVDASRIDHTHERELEQLLAGGEELVFSRASPEAKLQIAEALRGQGHTIAMTGDGVNDAPALRRADIGVAMGRSGTDVAREAATMILTDDNFATIVLAVEAGRRVYDNVRKFIVYIFAHATPEVVPFLLFALAGGAIPLPLTVLQILAFDVGTETLPSLALAREPAEPGLMQRAPRPRSEGVIRGPMLVRAWLFLGGLVALLSMGGFFYVLIEAGWSPNDAVDAGSALHHAYLQATTMTFLGMIAGQIGTAFAVRTQRASLREIGVFSNPYLLLAIVAELALAALCVYAPPLQSLLGTAALPAHDLVLLLPYPLIVWGSDELRRWFVRRRGTTRPLPATAP